MRRVALILSVLCLTGISYAATIQFEARVDYPVGAQPWYIVAADLNGDGRKDLAVANHSSATISVLMSNGNGLYAAAVNYTVADGPMSICAKSIDYDADIDLVVTNYYSDNVSILRNDGFGVFGTAQNVPTGRNPRYVIIEDVDSNGIQDFIVVNGGSNSISILKDNGGGTYSDRIDYAVGADPRSVSYADLDGDGRADLAVTNCGASTISTLRNTGSGNFGAPTNYVAGTYPIPVVAVDINGDKKRDLVTANAGSNNVSFFINNGDGTFAGATHFGTGGYSHALSISDFNGDGETDFAVVSLYDNSISLLKGNGDGSFVTEIILGVGVWPNAAFATDLDGDSKPDLAVSNAHSNSVSVLINKTVASPKTIRVPADQPTIQSGIDVAWNGDTVLVAPGVYTGTGNYDIDLRGKGISVVSSGGPEITIIDCQADSLHPRNGFLLLNGEDSISMLQGFTIRNPHVGVKCVGIESLPDGGPGGAPKILGCIIENSLSTGLEFNLSAAKVIGCRVSHSRSAAMFVSACSLSVSSCVFNYNVGTWWNDCAVIVTESGGVNQFDSCTFSDNFGTGILIGGWDNTLRNCLVERNGLHGILSQKEDYTDNLSIISSTVRGNKGAGILFSAIDGILNIRNSMIVENRYCGLFQNIGYATISRCSFINNAIDSGSSIEYFCCRLSIDSTLIMGGIHGPAITCIGSYATPVMNCSDIYGNSGGDWTGNYADQLGLNGNISADPHFCDTANGDYHIMDFSQCAPSNNSCGQLIGALGVGCAGIPSVNAVAVAGEVAGNVKNHLPMFAWQYSSPQPEPQDSFEIEIGTNTIWDSAEMWNPPSVGSADTSVTYAGETLVDGATYYLRLKVHNGYTWSPWYQSSFRMNSVPSVPTPKTPANDASANSLPTLWANSALDAEGDPLLYDFAGFHDTDCAGQAIEIHNVPGTADSTGGQVTSALGENCRYWWQVRAFDGYEYSEWSSMATFRVDGIPEPPTTPVLISPPGSDGLPVFTMLPTLVWSPSFDPDPKDTVRYKLEMEPFVVVDSLLTTSYTVTDSLKFGVGYWWRVTAWDKAHHDMPSTPKLFWAWALGDLNHSHLCDLSDLSSMVSYLTGGGYVISPKKVGDVNGSCFVDLTDLSTIVSYLTGGGAVLKVGCE